MAGKTILVTGATGKQGGGVAHELARHGHTVRGMTRNPDSPAGRALAAAGIQPVRGDFDDPASLVEAARAADAVFAMSTPFEAGTDAETRQGIAIADAARAAGVGHLLFSSVASADQETGIPHFESKRVVERHIHSLGVPFTIIAPVYFMENALSPWGLPALRQGMLAVGMSGSRPLQQVAVADVAGFGALVLERPDEFLGRRIDIASDEL
ncbi:MAG TPA: NmrA/HSCARG family protein, partial [Longimicrobium sp.]|nr:NmrA/HSCARG family protein [Longimicrobium sp.]